LKYGYLAVEGGKEEISEEEGQQKGRNAGEKGKLGIEGHLIRREGTYDVK
jgi:hypothetical protein